MIGRIIRGQKIRRPPRKGWNSRNTAGFAENIPPIRKPNKEIWAVRSEVVVECPGGRRSYSSPSFEAGADSELGQ